MLPSSSEHHTEVPESEDVTERAVQWTRYLVVAVFSLCAIVVGSLAYVVSTREETNDYKAQVCAVNEMSTCPSRPGNDFCNAAP